LMTARRRENVGEQMRNMVRAIKRLVDKHEDVQVVYPVNMNHDGSELANKIIGEHNRIPLIEQLDVIDFNNVAARSYLIVTDSG
ncbi:UDP-N-acetylglucosamine 2-epimerase, partial [Bacillus cereus]|uniref:UDP-N-acetylglucosamine 2-epimerase n=1 Tax=Bacillus cereus TaxID=1396 RepID=UPI002848487F